MRGQFLAKMWEQMEDAVISIDPAGLITHWNPAAERLAGYTAGEVLGKPLWQAQPPLLRSWVRMLFAQLQQRGFLLFQGQGWLVRKDRQRRAVAVHVEPWWDDQHKLKGWVGLLHDITGALVHPGLSVGASADAGLKPLLGLFQSGHAAEAMARGLTHQMSNMLTGVLSSLELALLEENLSEGLKQSLLLAEQSARLAAESNSRFSAFLRRPDCQLTPVDLGKVVEGTVALLRRCLDRRNQLVVEPARPDLWMARARESRVVETLVDLCLVAQSHLPRPGQIRIQLVNRSPVDGGPAHPGEFVELRVSHNGRPIEPQEQAGLLASAEGGWPSSPTGLALRIVKDTAEEQGGWFQVDTEPGGDTRMSVIFPRAAAAASPPSAPFARPDEGEVKRPDGVGRILVVDDEQSIRGLVSAVLSYRGYCVTEATDGQAALRHHAGSFDLALVDVDMPGLDGWEVLRELRARNSCARVLLMSGAVLDEAALRRLHQGGGLGLVLKPFRNLELLQTVRRALDQEGPPGSHPLLLVGG
jgi:PAS domain S-box-containing protein